MITESIAASENMEMLGLVNQRYQLAFPMRLLQERGLVHGTDILLLIERVN